MQRRTARLAIVLCLGIATLAYGALEKRVVVRVEGHPVGVKTYAMTVGSALSRSGISIGARDRVEPALGSSIGDGDTIQVYRAKSIVLLLDGKPRRVVVTGLTIDEVLNEIELRGSLVDFVRPSRSSRVRAGMTINYRRALALAIRHDDRTDHVVSNATTVGAVVRELGIKLGSRDRLEPSASVRPVTGMTIRVLRVGLRNEVREEVISYKTILRRDRSLEYGRRRVSSEGRPGLRRTTYLAKFVDGVRVSRRVLSTKTVRQPVDRVIKIGTGFPGCACDRGTQLGKASWYGEADGLSAAHRTLPMGTVVRVENRANGKWVNVVIRDRGPYVKGRIIDLSDEAFRRIASLRSGVASVRIRW
ncbi:MAG: ubiquitin-like domain-containing protein [Actinomycetota bacterium]